MKTKITIIAAMLLISIGAFGQTAYITNQGDSTISVIDVATNTVTAIIPLGYAPWGVSVNADGSKVYITNNNNTVSVINTSTNTVSATILVGLYPTGICVSPDG